MDMKKILAIAFKEITSNKILIASFLILSFILSLLFSDRSILGAVNNKFMIDTNYAYMMGMFMHMVIFGSLMNSEKREEKHHGYSFLKLLPANHGEIIVGKYFSVFINAILAISYISILNQFIYRYYEYSNFIQSYIFISASISLVLVGFLYVFLVDRSYTAHLPFILALYVIAMAFPQIMSLVILIIGKEQLYLKLIEQVSSIGFPMHLLISMMLFWVSAFWAIKLKKALNK